MHPEVASQIEAARSTGGQTLDLSGLGLSKVLDSLGNLTALTELNLSGNQLTALPNSLGNLTALTKLNLDGNQLTALPDSLGSLSALTELSLSGNQLAALPEWLGNLTALTELYLYNNQLTALPDSVGNLRALTTLNLDGNQLTALPDSLGNLRALTELYLSGNQLVALPDSVGNLRALTTLYLDGNQLVALPDSVGNLRALTTLYLDSNQLATLPDSLGNLRALTELYLSGNQLIALSEWLGDLRALTTLYLSGNQLATLPDSVGDLRALTALGLSGNQLTALPEWLGDLRVLTTLSLNNNQLTALPDSLGDLHALTELYLYNNKLAALPDSVGNLRVLTTLKLDSNQLTALPDSLGDLRDLTTLDLSGNQLTVLPGWLGNLTALTTLNLNNNQLTALPDSLGNLRDLTTLNLSGNQLTAPPDWLAELEAGASLTENPLAPELLAAYREGWGELRSLLRLLKTDGVIIREAKLVLVGEGKVGKSSLLASMRDDPWIPDRETTHGIEIKPLTVHDSDGTAITLNGWDFGGQPDYRPTHQLFFSAPAVYLVIWNPRLGPEVSFVEYWIEQIKHRAGDSARVHIVATHAGPGERGAWIDEAGIRQRFGDMIVRFHHVDSQTKLGIPELMTAIADTAAAIPHAQRLYPGAWLRLRTTLQDSNKPYLSYANYLQIATNEGLSSTSARSLAVNANALGHWIFYSDDPALADLVVLKPDWLSTAISFVLEDREARASGGLLAHRRLTHLWYDPARPAEQRYPPSVHPILLQLMEKFDISYRVVLSSPRDEPTSLVAQLVRSTQPASLDQAWDGYGPDLEERIQVCEILDSSGIPVDAPSALMYQLIVRFHRFSLGRHNHQASVHWQHGMISDDGYHGRALITAKRHRIEVRVRAAYPQGLLDRLTGDIAEHITGFWPGLTVRVLVPCGTACAAAPPGSGLFDVEFLTLTALEGMPKTICSTCKQFLTIDSLLAGVTTPAGSDDERLARVVAAATAPSFARLAATVADNTATVTQVVEHQNSRVLDAVAAGQAEVAGAISQTEQRLRDLLLALDDEARDGPSLFTVSRLPRTIIHPNITTQRLQITLWCEHSRLPVHMLNPTGPTGIYELDLPREWVTKAAPILKTASILLRTLLPASSAALNLSLPDPDRLKALSEQLHLAEESLEALTDAADLPDVTRPRPQTQPIGVDGPLRIDTAVVRILRTHIAKTDPSFSGLRRVTVRGRHLWVHSDFENLYHTTPPTIPTTSPQS